jgi:hypothetical protein
MEYIIKTIIDFVIKIIKGYTKKQNWYNYGETTCDVQKISSESVHATCKDYHLNNPIVPSEYIFSVTIVKVTSPYGIRNLPGVGKQFHNGTDYTGRNKQALACTDMVVKKIRDIDYKYPVLFKWTKEKGWHKDKNIPRGRAWTPYIILEDVNDPTLRYAYKHVKSLVQVGQIVNKGDIIAEIGNYGYSQGAHLHFEVLKKENGKWHNVDSHKFILERIKK